MAMTWRLWLLLFFLIGSSIAIFVSFDNGIVIPYFDTGVVIKSVVKNTTAFDEGLRQGMIITSVDGKNIQNYDDYTKEIESIFSGKNFTNKTKLTITASNTDYILYVKNAPEITVDNIPKTKLKTGLDLSGGARALVKADKDLSASEMNDLISVTSNRLNEFGISDVTVRPVADLSGKNYMLIEVAGATPTDLADLVSKQGKFEAKVGNETIFIGGKEDITYVARSGDQSGIYSCLPNQGTQVCSFRFAIKLSPQAAKRQADTTAKLSTDPQNPEYLSQKLDLYLDDNLVDSLMISRDLKGRATTDISIQGSGKGTTQKEAYDDAVNGMKKLQTVLITGSLPYKLEIVKIDTISPALGKEFLRNILFLGIIVFIMVSLGIFIKYRNPKISLGVIFTLFSEFFITIAIAALIKWNLDAPSIAGIIAGMGTGVDDQIVIIDEAVSHKETSYKEKLKNAFFIILSAYALTVVAMLPLFWAGAGMLKGFALTTIIGVSVGIFITRPAFSDIVKNIMKD